MAAKTTDAVSRNTLVDLAASALRNEVLSGALVPGSRIHLGATAERLGMSPIPVREALRTLSTEGLVVAFPHRGYRVPAVTLADLEDTYRLRLVLDPMATELAVPRLTPEHLEQAAEDLADLSDALDAADLGAIRVANRAFHFVLYEASDSAWLVRMISMVWENTERYHRIGLELMGTPEERKAEHAAILDACRARKPKQAARLMHEHLSRTFAVARRALEDGRETVPGQA